MTSRSSLLVPPPETSLCLAMPVKRHDDPSGRRLDRLFAGSLHLGLQLKPFF